MGLFDLIFFLRLHYIIAQFGALIVCLIERKFRHYTIVYDHDVEHG